MKTNFPGCILFPESPDVWRTSGNSQENSEKSKNVKILPKKETAWWSKKNGRKEEKQTKGINILSLQLVNGRYRFVKFTSFNRMTFRVYKSSY